MGNGAHLDTLLEPVQTRAKLILKLLIWLVQYNGTCEELEM